MSLMLKFALLFTLLLGCARGRYQTFNCNQGNEDADINNAVDDVVAVATAAAAALVSGKINGKEDVFQGAYDPLFLPTDKYPLITLFSRLSLIKVDTTLYVRIYCRESHIVAKSGSNPANPTWVDQDYLTHKNERMPLWVGSGRDKPGIRGSYTSIGFKDNDRWDSSGEAHVYIHERRRNPPANTDRDLRRYPEIVKNGLDGKHNAMEDIKPLAQTVMHELLHAVGGLGPPDPTRNNKRPKNIDDGPNRDTYGWLACNTRRASNLPNGKIADCITYLAQAIFLQIQGKDTYWTTGEIDPATLRPKNLP